MDTHPSSSDSELTCIDGKPRFFSDHTPDSLALLLLTADKARTTEQRGELLRQAVNDWPSELDGHIALYKHYFRTAQYREAEKAVWQTLQEAARQGGFTRNYRKLTSDSADWLNDKSVSRLYLFSLKALGVIRLRRGRIRLAEQVLSKLLELDPQDEIGGSNFLDIARDFNRSTE
jgi:tetratricopeptide (TPR) repeat protein